MIEKPTVLVVDHIASRRADLVGYLQEAGAETMEAQDCDGALEVVANDLPFLAFIEEELPVKSGFALLRELRQRHPEVKVVLLSQSATSFNVLQALRGGAFDFIARPLDSGEILQPTLRRAQAKPHECTQHSDLIASLETKTRALERTLSMMRAINSSVEKLTRLDRVESLLAGLLEIAAMVLDARCGFIVLIEPKSGDLTLRVGHGYGDALTFNNITLPPGLVSEAVRRNKPIRIADSLPSELDEMLNPSERRHLLPHPGILAAPLHLKGREAGMIFLCGHPDDHLFSREDLYALVHLAHHTALLLEHVGLVQQLRRQPTPA